jgi:hypothetical protein
MEVISRFFTEAINGAQNIVAKFAEGAIRHGILFSKTQAGKTGAMHATIALMFEKKKITMAYILCGSSELQLKNQAINDAREWNADLYNSGKIVVLFRQDFCKLPTESINNALVCVDESHLDQTKNQQLDKLLRAQGLSMDGNIVKLTLKNVFVLSVSATPYSEISALEHEGSYKKHIEQLIPGPGYYGLEEYNYDGRIHPTYNMVRKPYKMMNLLESIPKKYAVIRLCCGRNAKGNELYIRTLCRIHRYRLLEYNSNKTEIAMTRKEQRENNIRFCIEDEPETTTVVLIKGRLRAGKVVSKNHIGFVWEGADKSNSDTIIQGLLGRMCGYVFGDVKPLIYVPPCFLSINSRKNMKTSEISRAIQAPMLLPRNAKNLVTEPLSNASTNGTIQCPPISFEITTDDDEYIPAFDNQASDAGKKEYLQRYLQNNLHIVLDSTSLRNEQKEEIIENINTTTPHIRNVGIGIQESYFAKIRTSSMNGTIPNEHVSEYPPMTFMVTSESTAPAGVNYKTVYVIFYTRERRKLGYNQFPINERIAKDNGKSIFTISQTIEGLPAVAGGVIYLTEVNMRSQESLVTTLREYLTCWRNATEIRYASSISANEGAWRLSNAIFPNGKAGIKLLLRPLEVEFGITISVKLKRGRTTDGYFNLDKISW